MTGISNAYHTLSINAHDFSDETCHTVSMKNNKGVQTMNKGFDFKALQNVQYAEPSKHQRVIETTAFVWVPCLIIGINILIMNTFPVTTPILILGLVALIALFN